MNMYETMAHIQTSQMMPNRILTQQEMEHQYRPSITQTQESVEKKSNDNERKEGVTNTTVQDDTTIKQYTQQSVPKVEQRTLWSEKASPQPKRTPNRKIERIQESKSGNTFNTPTNKSPTTDEKGKERGDKRLKITQPNNDNKEQSITTKIKQEMIDEVMISNSTEL